MVLANHSALCMILSERRINEWKPVDDGLWIVESADCTGVLTLCYQPASIVSVDHCGEGGSRRCAFTFPRLIELHCKPWMWMAGLFFVSSTSVRVSRLFLL